MTSYLIVYGLLSVFSIADHIKQFKQLRLFFFLLSVLLLIGFSGFRGAGVGTDDLNYVYRFLTIPDISFWLNGDYIYSYKNAMNQEFLFTLLGSIVSFFTNDYVFFFFIIAFLSVGIASYNYYRYVRFVFLTLVLFFVHTYLYRDINQIRSAIAAAIGLFLISQIHDRKHLKVLVTISFASLFHIASFSLIVVYFFSFLKVTRKRLVVGYFLALLLGFIGVSSFFVSAFPNLGYITTKLVNYSNSKYADSVSLFDLTNIKNSFIFFVLIFFWNSLIKKVRYFEVMMIFYFLAVTWRILFNDFGIFSARIATFFGIVEVLLVPSLLYVFKQKLTVSLVILLYAFTMLYLNLYVKDGRNPYELSFLFF